MQLAPPPPPPNVTYPVPHAEFVFNTNTNPGLGAVFQAGHFASYPASVSGHAIEGFMLTAACILFAEDDVQFPMPVGPAWRPALGAMNESVPALSAQQRENTDVDHWKRRVEFVHDKHPRGSSQKYVRVVYRNSDSGVRIFGDVDKHDVGRVRGLIGKVKQARKMHALSRIDPAFKRQKSY